MSTENVDRVRAAIDALNGSGWDPDAVIPHFDPGAVHYPFPDWPGLDRYEGAEGLRTLMDEWTQSFDELHWEVVRLIDEEDRVVARIQQHGRARGSGVPAETEVSAVFGRIGPNGIGETRYWFGWEP